MESDERRIMGIADAFGREDRFEIKTESFIRMAQEAAAAGTGHIKRGGEE